ncbi:MAG: hypothetical protein KQ78_02188 [Candidatus Izimaplasma bacterium HR2]|nr:MAG: hypothetical protein KQ78_02188 [Candidatus Izimaplasma bacterium HR2]
MIKKLIKIYKDVLKKDPVKKCKYHRDIGCSHVDGMLCDMKTCKELKEYKEFLGE